MPDINIDWDDLGHMVALDFQSADDTRAPVAIRKLNHYALYRAYRDDTSDADSGRTDPEATGPFNWSRLIVPFGYYVTETFISRLSTDVPSVSVTPRTIQAVAHAEARQMRINRVMDDSGWDEIALYGLKDMAIMGDGFIKTYYDTDLRRPRLRWIPWLGFYFSSEAMTMDSAECLFHVTWHTRDSLERLGKIHDGSRKKKPLYKNIDEVIASGLDRSAVDTNYTQMRTYAGSGTPEQPRLGMTQVPVIEAHYKDGSVITVGGISNRIVMRAVESLYVDADGCPVRPFVSMANTPDPGSPYGIGDVEMVEDMQREASLVTNQAIDQATRNINRSLAYDATRVSSAQVAAAYGSPGGRLPVQGPPAGVLLEGAPVELSRDFDTTLTRIQQFVEMTSGLADVSKTPAPSPNPSQMETATGIWVRSQEANRRVDLKLYLVANAVRKIARRLDFLDRQFGGRRDMVVPVKRGYAPRPESTGIDVHPEAGIALVGPRSAGKSQQFDVTVDAGGLIAPMGNEVAQKALMLAHTLMDPQLGMADAVNTTELATMLVEAAGFEPARILSPQGPSAPATSAGAGTNAPAPPGPGAGATPAPGGSIPIGPPEPVGPPGGAPIPGGGPSAPADNGGPPAVPIGPIEPVPPGQEGQPPEAVNPDAAILATLTPQQLAALQRAAMSLQEPQPTGP